MSDGAHQFVCADCNIDVVVWGGDPTRDLCYNCTFVRRVCDTPEHAARMRKVLDCEMVERDDGEDQT